MNYLLMGVTENGTASRVTLKSSVDTAGKTGTSGEDRDRLFVGYTPYLTAGIWCGYTEGGRAVGHMSKSHITIWDEIMKKMHGEILKDTNDCDIRSFSSAGLVWRNFCRDSGQMATDVCALDPRGDRIDGAYFIKGSEPLFPCEVHVRCRYSEDCNALASDRCPYEGCVDIALLKITSRAFPKQIFISDAPYVYPVEYNEKSKIPQENAYSGIGCCENNYGERCKKHNGEFTFGKKRAIIG
jgi:penicillin-binding protein 1A